MTLTPNLIVTAVIAIVILLVVFLLLNRHFGLKKITVGKLTLEADANNGRNAKKQREKKKMKNNKASQNEETHLLQTVMKLTNYSRSVDKIKEDYLERKRRLTDDSISNLFFELRQEIRDNTEGEFKRDLQISNLDSGIKSLRISVENIIYKNHLAQRNEDIETKKHFLTLKSNKLNNQFKEDFDIVTGIDVKQILRGLVEQLIDLSVTEKELLDDLKERLEDNFKKFLANEEVSEIMKTL